MIGRKRILRVIAVLSIAVATGHAVETLRPQSTAGQFAGVAPDAAVPAADASQSALPASAAMGDGSSTGLPRLSGITSVAAATEGADSCAPTLALAAAPGAMIDVSLAAPCNLGERLVIRHAGLSFTAITSPEGVLRLRLPALEADALVAAYFGGSAVAFARVPVPEAASQLRVAIQMAYPVQFDLRAEEDGQVFIGSAAIAGEGGMPKILPLGTAKVTQPVMAQVYTLSEAALATANLTVEVRITPETCGRSFPAETVLARGGTVTRSTITIAVPHCGTAGDILLLKNLLHDLTLATSE